MKKFVALIIALMMLLSGCSFIGSVIPIKDNNIKVPQPSIKLPTPPPSAEVTPNLPSETQPLTTQEVQPPTVPDPAPNTESEEYHPQNLWETLVGWWVYIGEDRDEYVPELYYFTMDDKAYTPDNYNTFLYSDDGTDIHNTWHVENGKVVYRTTDNKEYNIIFSDETHMRLVSTTTNEVRPFAKNSAPDAIALLEVSPYYYLAEYPPNLCRIKLSNFYEDGTIEFLRQFVVLVREDDAELIAEYGLENAPFTDGYEIVAPSDNWYYTYHDEELSTYRVVLNAISGVMLREVSGVEFAALLEERGEMLVYAKEEEGTLFSVEEFINQQ